MNSQLIQHFEYLKLPVSMAVYEQVVENNNLDLETMDKVMNEILCPQVDARVENSQRLARRNATLKWPQASMDKIPTDKHSPFSRKDIAKLRSCGWAKRQLSILLIGASGLGKTTMACALANEAILKGYKVKSISYMSLIDNLTNAKTEATGNEHLKAMKLINMFMRVDILHVDDWGLKPLSKDEQTELFRFVEAREGKGSWVITSQFDVSDWHKAIENNYIGDSILDRIAHTPYRFIYKLRDGVDSFRKLKAKKEEQYHG
ncbi:ATP-binding protein [Shewanella pneumatophori]|uniref:ATP-binding protein n=1 Tax=Shewanella pneumatophori TaxID=314092 RepID=A0A9X2CFE7_9GAMM|nr:ATP-binding protein [Shewanella pneumatophori]MCL1137731.1 ATP-binding protein [Shewanella pneumatophori]